MVQLMMYFQEKTAITYFNNELTLKVDCVSHKDSFGKFLWVKFTL